MSWKWRLDRATAQRAFVDALFLTGAIAMAPLLFSSRSYSLAALLPVAVGGFVLRYMVLRARVR